MRRGALAHDRLEPAGDLAERALLGGEDVDRRWFLGEGVACGSAGFDGIGLLGPKIPPNANEPPGLAPAARWRDG